MIKIGFGSFVLSMHLGLVQLEQPGLLVNYVKVGQATGHSKLKLYFNKGTKGVDWLHIVHMLFNMNTWLAYVVNVCLCNVNSIVLVWTDLWGNEQHRQVGVGVMMTSGGLGGVMVSTLAWSTRDVGSILALGKYFQFSSHPGHWGHDQDHVQAMRWMFIEAVLCKCICKVIVCKYAMMNIKRLTIPEGWL